MDELAREAQASCSGPSSRMKMAINKYYKQLVEGCGRTGCENEDCASSGKVGKLTNNEAAARAILCLQKKAHFCESLSVAEKPENFSTLCEPEELNEERASAVLRECRAAGDWTKMRQYLDHVLGNRDILLRSFVQDGFSEISLKGSEQSTPEMPSSKFAFTDAQPGAPRKRRVLDRDQQGPSSSRPSGREPADTPLVSHRREEESRGEEMDTSDLADLAARTSQYLSDADPAYLAEIRRANPQNLLRLASAIPRESVMDADSFERVFSLRDRNTTAQRNEAVAMETSDVQHSKKRTSEKREEHDSTLLKELKNGSCPTNVEAARRCFRMLFVDTTDHEHYVQVAMGAVAQLCSIVDFQLQYDNAWERNPAGIVHIVTLIFELPFVGWFEFIEVGFTALCKMCANLGVEGHNVLASVWAEFEPEWLQDKVSLIQQALTVRIITVIDTIGSLPRFTDRCEPLPTAVQTLSILYNSVLVKSKRAMQNVLLLGLAEEETSSSDNKPQTPVAAETPANPPSSNTAQRNETERHSTFLDALRNHTRDEDDVEEERIARSVMIDAWTVSSDCLCIALSEFQNATLSENFSVEDDYVAYKSFHNAHGFSVMPEYSFILSTEVKQRFLILCNRVRQRSERRHAIEQSIAYGTILQPYLRLTVRRDHVVRDALDSLAAIAFDDVSSFKKQLRVYFDGEHAVDEGGVSKEFYQLVTQELFCPDYGMFTSNERTGLYWFNSQCTFCDDEYNLIGLLFGLAIYNNILVDVRFPTLLYTKLLARPAVFEELGQLDPDLYSGLVELLRCDENVEDIYCYTFQISYKDAYGNTHNQPLKANGENIIVTSENKKEFVALYADFILNQVVKRQFEAFQAGFNKAANCGLLRRICLPHEVEELVCGVLDLDFDVLAQSTRYQNGFNKTSKTIQDFWTVAKLMSIEEKKMLLQFITGSDRAPVGGLAKLEVVIARNGDDKKRLPTAHTCYNVILLPDYADLEVTRERLLKAISYSRGFGLQ